ncbi:MAG: transporter substrate-binding domain-containing protein [Cyanobacteria bacterium P01_A01_bin.114]
MLLRSLFSFGLLLGVQFAAPPISVSAELAEIQERGYLIVAVKDNWHPLGFRDQTGELIGFEIDIARRLAEELLGDPNAVELQPVSNLDRVNQVVEGIVDVAIANITITPQRQRITSFSLPYYLDGVGFITQSPQIQALEDLRTGQIALLNDSSTVAQVRYILPGATLTPVTTYQEALTLLTSQQVDAFAGDATLLAGWAQQDDSYHLLPDIISVEPLAIAIPKGTQYSSLRREINQLITTWHDEGWLQERANYWGLP